MSNGAESKSCPNRTIPSDDRYGPFSSTAPSAWTPQPVRGQGICYSTLALPRITAQIPQCEHRRTIAVPEAQGMKQMHNRDSELRLFGPGQVSGMVASPRVPPVQDTRTVQRAWLVLTGRTSTLSSEEVAPRTAKQHSRALGSSSPLTCRCASRAPGDRKVTAHDSCPKRQESRQHVCRPVPRRKRGSQIRAPARCHLAATSPHHPCVEERSQIRSCMYPVAFYRIDNDQPLAAAWANCGSKSSALSFPSR